MHPPARFPQPPPPGASPAATATALARALTSRGIAGIYTATADRVGLVSITAGVTAWTNGHQMWCTHGGRHYTWPAADIDAAAAGHRRAARLGPGAVSGSTCSGRWGGRRRIRRGGRLSWRTGTGAAG
jgi:hypothetical protein